MISMRFALTQASSKLALKKLRSMIAPRIHEDQLEEELYEIRLALTEAFANIADHAYANYSGGMVELHADFNHEGMIEIHLTDFGTPADPETFMSRDPDDLRAGGLGLCLISQVMDRVEMRAIPGRNILILSRKIGQDDRPLQREPFHILRRQDGVNHDIYLYGSFVSGRAWRVDLDEAFRSRARIDLAHLKSIDAHGLRELFSLAERLEVNGSSLEIVRIPERVRRMLIAGGVLARFACDSTGDRMRKGMNLLVINNEELFIRQVRKSCRATDVVRAVRNASAAREEMEKGVPNLVLLSMDLDDSESLFHAFRSNPSWARVPLILTGRSGRFERNMLSFRDDVDDFCLLPIESSELSFRIRRVIERSHSVGGSLPLLRALGNRLGPEALENLSDQIDELRALGASFMTGAEGWMRWGSLSLGSFVHRVDRVDGSIAVILGRGIKTGISTVAAGAAVAGIASSLLKDQADDIDGLAHEIARLSRKLCAFVEPYYLGAAVWNSGTWSLHTADGPPLGSVRSERPFRTAPLGSWRVDRPPSQLTRTEWDAAGPWRFLGPGFGTDHERFHDFSLDQLMHINADHDLWAFEIERPARPAGGGVASRILEEAVAA